MPTLHQLRGQERALTVEENMRLYSYFCMVKYIENFCTDVITANMNYDYVTDKSVKIE